MNIIDYIKARPLIFAAILIAVLLFLSQRQSPQKQYQQQVQQFKQAHNKQINAVKDSIELLSLADPHLLACIERAALDQAKIAPQNSGAISHVSQLKQLYCANQEVKNLIGIEELSQLEYLDISNNQVSRLDSLAALKQLQSLNINRNPVDDIDVIRQLPSLNKLQLPNLAETDCLYLEELLAGINSNLNTIRCHKKAKRSSRTHTSNKKPNEYDIEREIERFERDY